MIAKNDVILADYVRGYVDALEASNDKMTSEEWKDVFAFDREDIRKQGIEDDRPINELTGEPVTDEELDELVLDMFEKDGYVKA